MSISQQIEDKIRRLDLDRYTRAEIASKFHCSPAQISYILLGTRPASGLRLSTVDKMFPDAVIHLFGEKPSVSVGDNSAVAINHSHASTGAGIDKAKAMSAILALDIDADAKVKVLQALEGM